MFNEELLRQIKIAVRNPAYPHVEDKKKESLTSPRLKVP
jgi:hypothetical protein